MSQVSVKHREKMIRATAVLLPSKGLAGLSLVEVARFTGAPRGSLYHYFPGGWEELIHEALNLANSVGLDIIQDMQVASEGPEAIVQGMGARLKLWMKTSNFEAGCPVAAAALSAGPNEPLIRSRCADIYAAWVSALSQRLQGAGLSKLRADKFSQAVLDCFEGSLLRSRVQKNLKPIDSAIVHLQEHLRLLLAAESSVGS
jgi:TetR/AcrR family transcriptional regulator, lmrAB and yxaGH operons repressor